MSSGDARLDVARVRGLFPGLSDGFVHAEGPAGSLVPESVLRAVAQAMRVLRFKSAKYSVERPLHVGAALAGASAESIAALTAFAPR